jgi:hypothetical protein
MTTGPGKPARPLWWSVPTVVTWPRATVSARIVQTAISPGASRAGASSTTRSAHDPDLVLLPELRNPPQWTCRMVSMAALVQRLPHRARQGDTERHRRERRRLDVVAPTRAVAADAASRAQPSRGGRRSRSRRSSADTPDSGRAARHIAVPGPMSASTRGEQFLARRDPEPVEIKLNTPCW